MRATVTGKLGEKKIDRINRNVDSGFRNPYLNSSIVVAKDKSIVVGGSNRYRERPKTSTGLKNLLARSKAATVTDRIRSVNL